MNDCADNSASTNEIYKVYKYTNSVNGMVYIGQTCKTLEQRACSGENYKGCRYFYNAIKKYGWDAFVPEVLEDGLTKDEADEKEIYYISKYNSTDHNIGYNIANGGHKSTNSEETRRIISAKAKERYKDKTKNPMYGRKHSDAAREKMRLHSHHLRGEDNPNYGKKFSSERLKQMSEISLRWRKEHPSEVLKMDAANAERLRTEKPASKKVRCVESGKVWNSMTECANEIGVKVSTLSGHVSGCQKSCAGLHFEKVYDEV